MSYDIYLVEPDTKEPIEFVVPHNFKGGTYAAGEQCQAWLNVTYNYAEHFYRHMGDQGIRSIYGLTGYASIPILENAIGKLADDLDEDYWKPTEGNAKRALKHLLTFAKVRPDGIWTGD